MNQKYAYTDKCIYLSQNLPFLFDAINILTVLKCDLIFTGLFIFKFINAFEMLLFSDIEFMLLTFATILLLSAIYFQVD